MLDLYKHDSLSTTNRTLRPDLSNKEFFPTICASKMFGSKILTFSHIFPWGFLYHCPLSPLMRAIAPVIPPRPSPLELLPNEILYSIMERSDAITAIFLKNTSRRFRQLEGPDSTSFSRCEKWTIMCRLETDWLGQLQRDKWPATLLCTLCKRKRPIDQFVGPINFRAIMLSSILDTRPVQRDPAQRFCTRHPFNISWGPRYHYRRRQWFMSRRWICTHCGIDTTREHKDITGCDRCQCSLCPRPYKDVFVRTGTIAYFSVGAEPYIDGLLWSRDSKQFYVSEIGSR